MPFPDLGVLREFYGLLPPPPVDPFQFFLWEILSADALPARRDLAWQALKRIPALTPDAVSRVGSKGLLEAVGLAGPHREDRVERIRAVTGEFRRHRSQLEAETLTAVGLEKAARSLRGFTDVPADMVSRALLYAGGYLVLPLDDGAARVVARLEGTAIPVKEGAEGFLLKRAQWARPLKKQRRHARRVLAAALPREIEAYRDAVLYLRHHALHTCIAVGPHCGVCPLAKDCVTFNSATPPSDEAP